jgi:hypothetical protein
MQVSEASHSRRLADCQFLAGPASFTDVVPPPAFQQVGPRANLPRSWRTRAKPCAHVGHVARGLD